MLRIDHKTHTPRLLAYVVCVFALCIYPMSVFAEEAAPTTTETPTTTTQPSDSKASSTTTPTTQTQPTSTTTTTQQAPAPEPEKNYYYDPETKHWNTDNWQYDPVSGTYKKPPAPTPTVIEPVKTTEPLSKEASSLTINSDTTAKISNALDSLATTGDASVLKNTKAGDATTGDASATATIINNVNSSLTNANNTEAASFVTDITGDVNGDIVLQPLLLKAMLEAGAANMSNDQTINSKNSTTINNDVNLTAKSGDATVASNTNAGSAKSGDANTVADVVNIVNSMIAANQSFFGTINIYGNLNGDILIAPDFIPKLLATNGGGTAPAQSSLEVNSDNTQSIVNNVALTANTGQAAVTGNTSAGDATSGEADTNVVIFNLSGHEIVASNSLLVFVNVLGKWVGVIVDAPSGATAAAIGNNVQKNAAAPSLAINAVNDTQITNNINLASQTGDATVANNTQAGNATTGNATASANILNIANSQIGLSGWFGVLFINVYGTWLGSFGIDTSAGNPTAIKQRVAQQSSIAGTTKQAVSYIPHAGTPQPYAATTIVTPSQVVQVSSSSSPAVKAAQISDISKPFDNSPKREVNIPLAIGSLLITLGSLYALRRFLF